MGLEATWRRTNKPTDIYINNLSALKIINSNYSPTERTNHMDLRLF